MKLITVHKTLIAMALGLGILFSLRAIFAVMEGRGGLFPALVTVMVTVAVGNYLHKIWSKQDFGMTTASPELHEAEEEPRKEPKNLTDSGMQSD